MSTKSPQDLLREQMLEACRLISRLHRLIAQRISSTEKLLSDTTVPETARLRAEENIIAMLRALTDSVQKAASFLIAKGSVPAEPPAGVTTVEDILQELTGKTK